MFPWTWKLLIDECWNLLLQLFPNAFALLQSHVYAQNRQILTSCQVAVSYPEHLLVFLHYLNPFLQILFVFRVLIGIVFQNSHVFAALFLKCHELFPSVDLKHILSLEIFLQTVQLTHKLLAYDKPQIQSWSSAVCNFREKLVYFV